MQLCPQVTLGRGDAEEDRSASIGGRPGLRYRRSWVSAKLYQLTGRPADAHAIFTPALKGFAPLSEFPEIEGALELVATIEGRAQSGRR